MNMKVYNFLVNKHTGIRYRYHHMHDGSHGMKKVGSWLYLLYLNFCYYVLFQKSLDRPPEVKIYEEKILNTDKSESAFAAGMRIPVEDFIDRLSKYDIISFDIFDTLIFRPFTEPADLFYFLGERLGILDFKHIRMELEAKSRVECYKKHQHYEVNFADIWKCIEQETGVPAKQGMEQELSLEKEFCYANPYMLTVFRELKKLGKKVIAVSDMYLPEKFLADLLMKKGYHGIEAVYVSCEYGKSKGNGKLFDLVKRDFPDAISAVHIGDNEHSDVEMPKKHGFASVYYPNANKMALSYRPYDMSPVIGGAYRGIVDNYLYHGLNQYSMEYEYGFVYGGLFVLGYCHFVHEYKKQNGIDKILFLSRDGDILKQVYEKLYPEDSACYVYWSRTAATKLMAEYNRYDYFRRYIYHKVNQKKTLREILEAMEISELTGKLESFCPENGETGNLASTGRLHPEDELTDRNMEVLKKFLQKHFNEILKIYSDQFQAARDYYGGLLKGCRKACAVDIGWAGSGAISLSYLIERVWKIPCEIMGIVAGTNTVHNAEPDSSESFLQSGKLVSYLFSQAHNRDVMKKHDLNKNYNVYWELLLSSPQKHFRGFYHDETGAVQLEFGKEDANVEGIREIQQGIKDFAKEYLQHFGKVPYMLNISGRDAYAPMLLAASHKERYLKVIERKFALDINVE